MSTLGTLLLPLLAGADNLLFGGALGLLPLSRGRRLAFAAAFGAAELGMTLAGSLVGGQLGGELTVAGALLFSGLIVLFALARGRDLARIAGHPLAILLLPPLLALDNLAAGARIGEQGGLSAALASGAVCAGMAAVGLFLGAPLGARRPRLAAALCGAGLVVLAFPRLIEALS